MKKQYDDFSKLKIDDMSKSISDMTLKYINPETQEPTKVPPEHYKKLLGRNVEIFIDVATQKNFLNILYEQLSSLKKDNEKFFYQALLCLDLKIKPSDLRIDEQIALNYAYDYMTEKQNTLKKDFHMLDSDVIETFENAKNDKDIQSKAIRESNEVEDYRSNEEKYRDKETHHRYYDDYDR